MLLNYVGGSGLLFLGLLFNFRGFFAFSRILAKKILEILNNCKIKLILCVFCRYSSKIINYVGSKTHGSPCG